MGSRLRFSEWLIGPLEDVMADKEDDQVQPRQLVLRGGPQALLPYAGKTVAIVDGEVKLSGTWEDVVRAAHAQKLVRPVFMYVPAGRVIG